MAAFWAAARYGLPVELDVLLSADGQAVVFHDEDLTRMTGEAGTVGGTTADHLRTLHLAGTGETIPLLRDVLTEINGRVPLADRDQKSGGNGRAAGAGDPGGSRGLRGRVRSPVVQSALAALRSEGRAAGRARATRRALRRSARAVFTSVRATKPALQLSHASRLHRLRHRCPAKPRDDPRPARGSAAARLDSA